MPFRVQYGPSAAAVAQAAYAGGLGQYQKWVAEQQLKQAALEQDALNEQARIYSANQNQAYNRQADFVNRQAQRQFDATQSATDFDRTMIRDLERDRRERDTRVELADMMADRADASAESAAYRAAEDDRRRLTEEAYKRGEIRVDPAAEKRLTEIRTATAAIHASKSLSPVEKQRKKAELTTEFYDVLDAGMSLPRHGEIPKTLDERVDSGDIPAVERPWLDDKGRQIGVISITENTPRSGGPPQIKKEYKEFPKTANETPEVKREEQLQERAAKLATTQIQDGETKRFMNGPEIASQILAEQEALEIARKKMSETPEQQLDQWREQTIAEVRQAESQGQPVSPGVYETLGIQPQSRSLPATPVGGPGVPQMADQSGMPMPPGVGTEPIATPIAPLKTVRTQADFDTIPIGGWFLDSKGRRHQRVR